MTDFFNIHPRLMELSRQAKELCAGAFARIGEIEEYNSQKVLAVFHSAGISEVHLKGTGYGYDDRGRLPLIGGVIASNQGLFPKYDAGLYTQGDCCMDGEPWPRQQPLPPAVQQPPGDCAGGAAGAAVTRQHWLDDLRTLGILLLFPVHTAMVWNDFGSRFYVWAGESRVLSTLLVLVNPWFMPLLFAVAGASARHALGKYSPGEFLRRRAGKLLTPLIWGVGVLCPVMTLYARRYFYRYSGGLWDHWRYFFSHTTDLSGYDGCFTPGHYWFILYLFFISAAALPVFARFPQEDAARWWKAVPAPCLLLLFLPIWLMYHLGNFGGYSLGKCFSFYLLGYYLLSDGAVLDRLEDALPWLLGLWGGCAALSAWLYWRWSFYGDLWVCFASWTAVLALFPLARKYRPRPTRLSALLGRTSYSLYLLHQPVLVVLAYAVVGWPVGMALQALFICAGSFLLTLALCLVLKKLLPIGIRLKTSGPAARSRRKLS